MLLMMMLAKCYFEMMLIMMLLAECYFEMMPLGSCRNIPFLAPPEK